MRTTLWLRIGLLIGMTLASLPPAFSAIYDWEAPPKRDHYMALRCYIPEGLEECRAIIVFTPGFNGDARKQILDSDWEEFAKRNKCALIGCSIRGGEGGIYYETRHWSGKLLLQGIQEISKQAQHAELDQIPLGLIGMSCGGMFSYNFACWKPERTFAFVTNKGPEYDAQATSVVRQIPSLWIAGALDTERRMENITSLYAENRRRGAAWGLIVEPALGHVEGHSKELGITFFEEVLAQSFGSDGKFKRIDPGMGWLADFQTKEISKNSTADFGPRGFTWLPGEMTADLWKAIMLGLPTSSKSGEPKI